MLHVESYKSVLGLGTRDARFSTLKLKIANNYHCECAILASNVLSEVNIQYSRIEMVKIAH